MMESARKSEMHTERKVLDRANKIYQFRVQKCETGMRKKEIAERNGAISGKGEVDHTNHQ